MSFWNNFAYGFSNSFNYSMGVVLDNYIMRSVPADAASYCYANLDSPSGLSSPYPLINYAINRPYMGGFTGIAPYGFPLLGFDNSYAINSLGSMGLCYLA